MNRPVSNVGEYTVSEISFALKRTVEDNFERVRVRGEVSGFKGIAGSGHCYFRLKDERACLEAVIWKTTVQRLRVKPQEGLEVLATGKLTTYPGRSNYQIVIDTLEPAGEGALMALLEERRRKLQAEGLFDPARKRPIPYLPRVIGVVTSPTGAVIEDILHRLRARFPRHVLVWPVRVQGDGAADEVAAAVRGFNAIAPGGAGSRSAIPRPDVLIVARGGGSVEDLWAFNEEIAVRAVAASDIPVIAAVGHETDWSLIDHAADLRAPTPTGAAEMAVPVRAELMAATGDLAGRLDLAQRRGFENRRRGYVALCRALPSLDGVLGLRRQKLDDVAARLDRAATLAAQAPARRMAEVKARLGRSLEVEVSRKRQSFAAIRGRMSPLVLERADRQRRERLAQVSVRATSAQMAALGRRRLDLVRSAGRMTVESVARIARRHAERYGQTCRLFDTLRDTASPQAILAKGYALVRDGDNHPVTSPDALAPGEVLRINVAEGEFHAAVTARPAARARPRSPRQPTPTQESLF